MGSPSRRTNVNCKCMDISECLLGAHDLSRIRTFYVLSLHSHSGMKNFNDDQRSYSLGEVTVTTWGAATAKSVAKIQG